MFIIKSAQKSLTILVLLFTFSLSYGQYNNSVICNAARDQVETVIAVNPLNSSVYLAGWSDNRDNINDTRPWYAFSTDGGKNWNGTMLTIFGDEQVDNRGKGPTVAFNNHGTAFYCCKAVEAVSGIGPIYISMSNNLGIEWVHKEVSINDYYQDKPYLAIDNTGGTYDGRIYVSWTDLSDISPISSRILFRYSSDDGSNFEDLKTLDAFDETGGSPEYLTASFGSPEIKTDYHYVQGSMPAVGPNGNIYVVWYKADQGGITDNSQLRLRTSSNGGEAWTPSIDANNYLDPYIINIDAPFMAEGKLEIRPSPAIAVDPLNENNIYIVYTEEVFINSISTTRIKWIRSTNKGEDWSESVTIGEVGGGADFFPALTVEPSGRISIEFLHSRYYPNQNDNLVDTYITTSVNNGDSFLPPVRVSKKSYDAKLDGGISFYYQGCSSVQGKIFPIWADFRNEDPQMRPDVYFSPITMVDDVSPDTWSDNVYV
ncbi:MAG: sialidase family protein, partial [Bacteroidota bacterium]